MLQKLNERDKRALKIGILAVALVLVTAAGLRRLENWGRVRKSLAAMKNELNTASLDFIAQENLKLKVPAFEMPRNQDKQQFLFRNKLNEQMKKAGIKSEPLRLLPVFKSQVAGYKLLRLECKTKCDFSQMLELLAGLNENPYLAAIEELRIKCDEKNRQQIEMSLTVSAFVR